MISYSAAIGIIASAARALTPRTIALGEARGYAAATELRCAAPIPPFPNAAMDGYALAGAATLGASAGNPVALEVAGSVPAGEAPPSGTPPGTAWEIMTGAAMPAGCDAVLPVERAILRPAASGSRPVVLVPEPCEPGRNRRDAGTDFRAGDLLLGAGDEVTPVALMALAAAGIDAIPVRMPPRVAVLTTGSELATSGRPAPGTALIRDSNGPYVAAMLAALSAPPIGSASVRDDTADVARELARLASGSDLVLTTGGVSAGRLDCVPAAIGQLGGEVLFHKVAIRPGKPLLLARLPSGTLVFGLPGNPMAVAVGLRFFVLPALRALMGRSPESFVGARVVEPVRKRPALTFFAKAHAGVGADARLEVRVLPGQESYRIAPLLQANCWAIVPEGREDVAAGEILEVAPLLPTGFPAARPADGGH